MDIRYQYDVARSNGVTPEQAANYVRGLARRRNPEMKQTRFDQIFLEQEAARDLDAMHHEIGQAEMRFISLILERIARAEQKLDDYRSSAEEWRWGSDDVSDVSEIRQNLLRQVEEWEATVTRLQAMLQAVQDKRIARLCEMQAEGLAIS